MTYITRQSRQGSRTRVEIREASESCRAYRRALDPHEGTREGARAAWGFVIDAPFGIEAAVPLMRAWNIRAAAMAEFAQVVGAKYRRELEAI